MIQRCNIASILFPLASGIERLMLPFELLPYYKSAAAALSIQRVGVHMAMHESEVDCHSNEIILA